MELQDRQRVVRDWQVRQGGVQVSQVIVTGFDIVRFVGHDTKH